MSSGQTKTLVFKATGIVESGARYYNEVRLVQETKKENPLFLVIDDESISWQELAIIEIGNDLGLDPGEMVNEPIAGVGIRAPLGIPTGTIIGSGLGDPPGTTEPFWGGGQGDEGWFALKTIPDSWADAGPTSDGLRNYILAGPGLGTPDADGESESLLDKVPDVTPLRNMGMKLLEGKRVCALVYQGDVGMNYGPLEGNLKGATAGLIAFEVLAVQALIAPPYPEPQLTIQILDKTEVCDGPLALFLNAPIPLSSGDQVNDVEVVEAPAGNFVDNMYGGAGFDPITSNTLYYIESEAAGGRIVQSWVRHSQLDGIEILTWEQY